MRKKHSFLLTLIAGETVEKKVQGRLEVISTGKTLLFSSLDELLNFIAEEMKTNPELECEGIANQTLVEG